MLLLGGTGEARALAEALHREGVAVTTSLAGRVAAPRRPPGELRVGGFGGVAGLVAHLEATRPSLLVDATHPFAAQMSAHAVLAAAATGTPLLRLERPPWREQPGDVWHRVPDPPAAAAWLRGPCVLLPAWQEEAHTPRVLLTLGGHGLAAFQDVDTAHFLVRAVDPPATQLPPHAGLLLDRGPFTLDGERALLHDIDLLVSRDSGGAATAPKLQAARERGIPVLLVDRPPTLPAPATAATVGEALAWLRA